MMELLPSKGIQGDTDKIEGHQVDFVGDGDKLVVTFKMTDKHNKLITDALKNHTFSDTLPIEDGDYEFKSCKVNPGKPVVVGSSKLIRTLKCMF